MDVEKVFHMTGGVGKTSYAQNSSLQKKASDMVKHITMETIQELYYEITPKSIGIADLGCSSGPNSLSLIKDIVEAVEGTSHKILHPMPEFRVYLNDLPTNDFNSVFKSLPDFYRDLKKDRNEGGPAIFIAGYPGSFYGRLFPNNCLHFIYSSYSLHWLSKVPDGVENNKWNVYMARSSPPNVFNAYAKQFGEDFSLFLRMRSEEIKSGGCMILTLNGRSNPDPSTEEFTGWDLLAESLSDLVSEGVVKEGDLDSFNIPQYTPYKEEVRKIIEEEGSFEVDRLEVFEFDLNNQEDQVNNNNFVVDKYERGLKNANCVRAVTEHLLASHFGDAIIERLFARLAIHEAEHLDLDNDEKVVNIVVSMTKK
ncbi:hypothetical protein REPUB_Repub09cG0187600 [Reevesia pubescens]